MFYKPSEGHELPHNPFGAIVTPRPIGWISTRDLDGCDNLAPYSFFNAIAYEPPQVMFSSTSKKPDQPNSKDSVSNIDQTGCFCVNIVSFEAREIMNATSRHLPKDQSEFDYVGLPAVACNVINCARVADAPAALECIVVNTIQLAGQSNYLVLGEVVGIHLRDDCLNNGRFDVTTYQPLGRLGYRDYAKISEVFELSRPDD